MRIICEGPFEGSSLTLNMENRALFERQLETFCGDRYRNCEIYRMIIQKYEEE